MSDESPLEDVELINPEAGEFVDPEYVDDQELPGMWTHADFL